MRPSSTAVFVLLLLLLGGGGAARGEPDKEERARAHFEAGRVRYNLGDYPAAVREFADGYRLVPRPQFLVNLGQAYRRLGQLERAREMYNRFLADTPAGDRSRPQVKVLIAEIERELARTVPPPPSEKLPPEPAPDEAPPPVVAAPVQPAAEPIAADERAPIVAAAAPAAKPAPAGFWRRRWWIVPLAGVALTGLVVGIYFGVHPSGSDPDCSGSSLGCLDLKH